MIEVINNVEADLNERNISFITQRNRAARVQKL